MDLLEFILLLNIILLFIIVIIGITVEYIKKLKRGERKFNFQDPELRTIVIIIILVMVAYVIFFIVSLVQGFY